MTTSPKTSGLQQRHLRLGWGSLLVFVVLGGVLEAMHGFKVDWYLSVGNETQRLLWRLAHAHGTFLSLVNIGFAVTIPLLGHRHLRLASACFTSSLIALPGGFLLGAFGGHGGDPGLGILLVPIGLIVMVIAIICTLRCLGD
jgi:hypothetical protein